MSPAQDERLTFTRSDLVYWLVADAGGHVASLYGLREDAEMLYQLPVPTAEKTPAAVGAALRRVRGAVEAAATGPCAELVGFGQQPCRDGGVLPGELERAMTTAVDSGVWPAAARAAQAAVLAALSTQVHRDQLDQARGQAAAGDGWAQALLWSLQLRLRCQAREVTRWPLIDGEVELVLGGRTRSWAQDDHDQDLAEI